MIVDVDTHFEPGPAWLDDYPALSERLPERFSVAESTVRAQVGDLLRLVPEQQRPPIEQLVPPGIAAILGEAEVEGYGFEGSAMHTPGDAGERLAWMDRVGIDIANTICLEGADYGARLEDRALAREVISACNSWIADRVDGNEDRLPPLTSIDATDIDWSVERAHADARPREPSVPDCDAARAGIPADARAVRALVVGGRGSRHARLRPCGPQSHGRRSRVD